MARYMDVFGRNLQCLEKIENETHTCTYTWHIHAYTHMVCVSRSAQQKLEERQGCCDFGRAGDFPCKEVWMSIFFACNMMVKFIQFSNLVAFSYARHQISSYGYILRGISILYTCWMVFHFQILLCRYHVSSRLLRSMSGWGKSHGSRGWGSHRLTWQPVLGLPLFAYMILYAYRNSQLHNLVIYDAHDAEYL